MTSRKRTYEQFDTNSVQEEQRVSKAPRTRDRPVVLGKRSAESLDACSFDAPSRPDKRVCLESTTGYPASFAYEAINRIIRQAHLERVTLFAQNTPPAAEQSQPDMMECVVFG